MRSDYYIHKKNNLYCILYYGQTMLELIFHSQPAGLRWARADESHIAQTLELPGSTRPVGPPPISTTFPSPPTGCTGSQLVTAARFFGQQTAARHRPLPPQRQLRHRRLRPRRAQLREPLQSHGRVRHPRLARHFKFCRGLADGEFSEGGDQCCGRGAKSGSHGSIESLGFRLTFRW